MAKTRTPHVYAYEKDGNTLYYVTFYCKQWDGTNKKIKKMGFTRQADAAQYERDYRDKLAGSPSMTFGALCDRYLDDLRNHVKESTWFNRQNVIKLRLLPVFSDVPISDITPAMIREWQNTVIAGNTFKPSYLANIHGPLATVFNFACKYFGLAQNPATIAGGMGTLKRQHDIAYWTREQFARFILSGLKPEYVAIFATLFWTGCRVGECLALTAADIDLTQGTMNINKTVTYAEHGFTIGTPKTASSRRVVTLPKHLCMILADWIKRTDARGNDRLFAKRRTTISYVLREHTKKTGLPFIRIHDLRHSHASMLINMDVPPKIIQERLGHASIQITLDTYSHLYPNKQKDLAALLSE